MDSLRLKEAFHEKAWLADFSLEHSTKLGKWMKSMSRFLPNLRPGLTQVVTETPEHGELQAEVPSLTNLLNMRSSFLGSVAVREPGVPRDLPTRLEMLRTARVYSTLAITTRFSITTGGAKIEGKPEQKADIMLQVYDNNLEVLISSKAAKFGRLPPSAKDLLSHYLGLTTDKDILLVDNVFTAYDVDDVRDHLVKHEISITADETELAADHGATKAIFKGLSSMGTVAFTPMQGADRRPNGSQSRQSGSGALASGFSRLGLGEVSHAASPTSSFARPRRPPGGHPHNTTRSVPISSRGPHRTNCTGRLAEASSDTTDSDARIKGELLVYELLKEAMPEMITANNWTSELRHLGKPELGEWIPPDDTTFFADFTIIDDGGTLRQWLANEWNIDLGTWADKLIRFNLEVKSTKGDWDAPFHMSDWQLEAARDMELGKTMTLDDGRQGVDAFLVLRVCHVDDEGKGLTVVGNLWEQVGIGSMVLRAQNGFMVWRKLRSERMLVGLC